MQRNWIGKSEGSRVDFPVKGKNKAITIFTTRVDTIYGATFMVLAPDHPMLAELVDDPKMKKKIKEFSEKVQLEMVGRSYEEEIEKEGLDTDLKAINPFTEEEIPVWISNFVLMEYGTGAVMSVPAHDQRDYEFAVKYGLPIRTVILPSPGGPESPEDHAYEAKGILTESGRFSGMNSADAIAAMNKHIEEIKIGSAMTDYRLKDWCISRQRFWGTPIPIIYCEKCGAVPVPEENLPVLLPEVKSLSSAGSTLAAIEDFVNTKCPNCSGPAVRETDTMDTFVDSAWYMLRYCDARIENEMLNRDAVDYWLPVDIYIGGIEHAVGHLMYFRYFYQRLRDLGIVKRDEHVTRLFTQGMVIKDGHKMSKSKGNVVDPNEMIALYGADTTRMFSLFGAPPEKDLEWSEKGVEGIFRFLKRVWNTIQQYVKTIRTADFPEKDWKFDENERKLRRKTHQTIKRVTNDVEERLHFNTAISAIMELINEIQDFELKDTEISRSVLKEAIYTAIVLLAIFAPHLSEELYHQIGGEGTVVDHPWPAWDEDIAAEEMMTVVIQVNGKLRSQVEAPVGTSEDKIIDLAERNEKVLKYIKGMKIMKKVYIPGKLLNFVLKK
jgi:leucyl-tRNA synthetase